MVGRAGRRGNHRRANRSTASATAASGDSSPSCTTTTATNHTSHPGPQRVARHDRRGVPGERRTASSRAARCPGPGPVETVRIRRSGTRSTRTHFVLCTPGSAGTITRAGYPWSGASGAPLTARASSASGCSTCPEVSVACAKAPCSSERTTADAGAGTPASAARSRSRTPVQVCTVDQPSTQAIGSVAVCLGSARERARGRAGPAAAPPVSSSTPAVERPRGSIPEATKVLLTGKSFGPPSAAAVVRPRGSRSARPRSGPPTVWPAVSAATSSDPPPTSGEQPAAAHGRRRRVGATRPSGSGSSGRVAATDVRSSARSDRDRSARHMCGSLSATCATKPPMNTHAPT